MVLINQNEIPVLPSFQNGGFQHFFGYLRTCLSICRKRGRAGGTIDYPRKMVFNYDTEVSNDCCFCVLAILEIAVFRWLEDFYYVFVCRCHFS